VRRGRNSTKITCLTLVENPDHTWLLAATSLTSTVHVFVVSADASSEIKNVNHTLFGMSGVLPSYFSSEFSFGQFKIGVDSQQPKICVI
jgi:hypothetical protein